MFLKFALRRTDVQMSPLSSSRNLFGVLAAIVVMATVATASQAQTRFDEEFDEQNKPWQEVAVQLPPTPVAENLLPYYVSPIATQTFYIDAKSLTVGADAVVRYTMVSVSGGGAKNISYEGIRCQSLEKKLYAFGREDGTWSRSRRDKWERMLFNVANRQHASLAQDYLCQGGMVAGKADDIIKRIRNKQPFSPES